MAALSVTLGPHRPRQMPEPCGLQRFPSSGSCAPCQETFREAKTPLEEKQLLSEVPQERPSKRWPSCVMTPRTTLVDDSANFRECPERGAPPRGF